MKVFVVTDAYAVPIRCFSCLTRAKEYVTAGGFTIWEMTVKDNIEPIKPDPIIYHWLDESGEFKTNVS